MTTSIVNSGTMENPSAQSNGKPNTSNCKLLRMMCWTVALALGAAQAWATRFTMNPDGVSYLDIGDAYWRGDWHNAINAYWSPLYSWILGLFLKVLRPSPYWEYPLVHLVNFLIYVGALACFEFFLTTFIRQQIKRDRELAAQGEIGIPKWAWWILGYSLFVFCSLVLIGLHLVTPDLLVSGCVYYATALILKIMSGLITRSIYFLLGIILGFGYLAKAAMFPLGLFFVATAFFAGGRTKKSAYAACSTMIVFLTMASPFIAALSHKERKLTFSNVGSVAYEVYVDGVDQFVPDGYGLKHPIHRIFSQPATFEFMEPVRGTYPLWYDPDYWHAGLEPSFRLAGESQTVRTALLLSLLLIGSVSFQLALTTGVLVLFLLAPRPSVCFKRAMDYWYLTAPGIAAFLMYAMVYFEYRYVAPFVGVGWIVLFSGVRLPGSKGLRIALQFVILTAAFQQTVSGAIACNTLLTGPYTKAPIYFQAARDLERNGIGKGDRIALLSEQPWGEGGSFVARLAGIRAVVQVNKPSEFWQAPPKIQLQLLESVKKTGVRAVLAWRENPPATGWQQLDRTNYSVYVFSANSR